MVHPCTLVRWAWAWSGPILSIWFVVLLIEVLAVLGRWSAGALDAAGNALGTIIVVDQEGACAPCGAGGRRCRFRAAILPRAVRRADATACLVRAVKREL